MIRDTLGAYRSPLRTSSLAKRLRFYRDRYVHRDPEWYRVYAKFPEGEAATPDLGTISGFVEDFERLSEGRLDVRGTTTMAVQTDYIHRDRFDAELLTTLRRRLRDQYASPYVLRTDETWQVHEGKPARDVLLVPVKSFAATMLDDASPAAEPDRKPITSDPRR
jgi:hypothetical protein